MRGFSAALLGLGLAAGLAATAQAAPTSAAFMADREVVAAESGLQASPYHHCHGASAGTADHACGSLTGGPAGGLF